ncbi:TPR-like protein, partial [Lizonia empirigonia]
LDLQQLHQQRPSTMDILFLMSFFDPRKIPLSVVLSYSKSPARKAITGRDHAMKSLRQDIAILKAKSIVVARQGTDTVVMETDIQSPVQAWLQLDGAAEKWEQTCLEIIAQEFPTGEYGNWSKCQELAPHVERFNPSSLISVKSLEAWAHAMTNVAWYQCELGDYRRAQNSATASLHVRLKVLGAQDERTVDSMEILAGVLLSCNSYEKAESLNRQALEWRRANLDADDPSLLTTMGNLALALLYLGEYSESEELHRRVLCESEAMLGLHHVDTLTSVSNLALLLRYRCRYSEAETLDRRALKGFRATLGASHPSTLTSANNLAMALQKQGRYGESEKLLRWSLKKKIAKIGLNHPSTLMSRHNL